MQAAQPEQSLARRVAGAQSPRQLDPGAGQPAQTRTTRPCLAAPVDANRGWGSGLSLAALTTAYSRAAIPLGGGAGAASPG